MARLRAATPPLVGQTRSFHKDLTRWMAHSSVRCLSGLAFGFQKVRQDSLEFEVTATADPSGFAHCGAFDSATRGRFAHEDIERGTPGCPDEQTFDWLAYYGRR